MTEMEGPEIREEMLVHVVVCPAKQLFSLATAVVVVSVFACRQVRLRRRRLETFLKANEVQTTAMIDLYGVLGEPAG